MTTPYHETSENTSKIAELPTNLDAEKAVLGRLIQSSADVVVTLALSADDFSLDSHQKIYIAIRSIAERGAPPDIITLSEELGAARKLESVGGAAYLSSLTEGLPLNTDIEHHAAIVAELAARRRWIHAGEIITNMAAGGATADQVAARVRELIDSRDLESPTRLRAVDVASLIRLDIPAKEALIEPFLQSQGIVEIVGYRGCGKTYIALGIAVALASGGRLGRWIAPKPRRVLYVDGEMPAIAMKERVARIMAHAGAFDQSNLKLITPDLQGGPMPDLATREGQMLVERELDGVEVLVLDNLSCLVRSGVENEAESWKPIQSWLLRLRAKGISIIFLHHAGKNGTQRGTSSREDVIDSVLILKRPSDYDDEDGLRVEVVYDKHRHFQGAAAGTFELSMTIAGDGGCVWEVLDSKVEREHQAAKLFGEGKTVRRVAEELDISRSEAGRIKKKVTVQ